MGYNSTYEAGDIDDAITDLIVGTADSTFDFTAIIGIGVAAAIVSYLIMRARKP